MEILADTNYWQTSIKYDGGTNNKDIVGLGNAIQSVKDFNQDPANTGIREIRLLKVKR